MQKTDPVVSPEYHNMLSTAKALWRIGSEKAVQAYQNPAEKPYGIFRISPTPFPWIL